MKKLIFAFLFVLNGFMSFAQIQNGSFELGAPATNASQFNSTYVTNWNVPTTGSSDIFPMTNTSYLWPPASSGNRLAGLFLEDYGYDYKEYITNTFSFPLVAGTTYNITIRVRNNGNLTQQMYSTNTNAIIPLSARGYFGVMFSTTIPTQSSYASLPNNIGSGRVLAPAIHPLYTTVNTWVPVTFSYTAVGGENYMTIGQYRPGIGPVGPGICSCYYLYIDDVQMAVALPVELINFNAVANESDRTVSVTWQTQSEINNDYFEVQRSTDFQNWTSVEQVDGAGDSEILLNYTARDLDPLTGISYYRLKQVDKDGKFSYSDVRSVKLGLDLGDELLTVFPNPATTEFTVYGERLFPEDFSLFNSLGESVPLIIKASNDDMIVYSIEGMENGVYILNYNSGMEIIHKKVFIEK